MSIIFSSISQTHMHLIQMLVLVVQQGQGDLAVQVVQIQELHFDQENLLDLEDPQWTHLLDPKDTNIQIKFFGKRDRHLCMLSLILLLDTHKVQFRSLTIIILSFVPTEPFMDKVTTCHTICVTNLLDMLLWWECTVMDFNIHAKNTFFKLEFISRI